MNVPPRDGQFLHDVIVEGGYTRALEIGTTIEDDRTSGIAVTCRKR